jgi:hypothetical protein
MLRKEIYGNHDDIDAILIDIENIHKMLYRFIATIAENQKGQ